MSEIHAPQGTAGSWLLSGTDGDDALYGGKGDNRFEAGAGNDIMYPNASSTDSTGYCDGGDGVDTVVLGKTFSHWQIEFDAASGTYRAGGITLKNVEYIDFGDVKLKIEDTVDRSGTQHVSTDGDDQLIGNDFGYFLAGGNGNDTLIGNGGDDSLHGGKGDDTAVYRGNRADYTIVFDRGSGSFVVTDHQAGRDGQDHLIDIENLRFADTTIHLAFTQVYPVQPTDATLALIDGVIGTPYVPPEPGSVGEVLFWVSAAGSTDADELPVALAGSSDFRATDPTGFLIDAR